MEAQLRLLTAPKARRPATTTSADDPDAARTPAGAPSHETEPAPALEPGPTAWRLSASTRAVGRDGIQSARDVLRQARPSNDAAAGTDAHPTHGDRGRSAA